MMCGQKESTVMEIAAIAGLGGASAHDGEKQEAGGEGGALTSLVFSHSLASALKSSAETADTPRFTRQRRSGRQRMTTSTAAGVGKRERERDYAFENGCA